MIVVLAYRINFLICSHCILLKNLFEIKTNSNDIKVSNSSESVELRSKSAIVLVLIL